MPWEDVEFHKGEKKQINEDNIHAHIETNNEKLALSEICFSFIRKIRFS